MDICTHIYLYSIHRWIRWLNIIKMLILPQTDVHMQCNRNQNLSRFSHGNWQADSNVYMEMQITQKNQSNFGKKRNEVQGFVLPDIIKLQKSR